VRKYQELLRLHPDMAAARANLGVVLVSLGRFDEATPNIAGRCSRPPATATFNSTWRSPISKKAISARRSVGSALCSRPNLAMCASRRCWVYAMCG
jgi:hypothetical protein